MKNYLKSSVVVFESLSTGLFECLVVKKPVILFINQNYLICKNELMKNFLNKMNSLGLVSKDVNSLFLILNQDIEKWWESKINNNLYKEICCALLQRLLIYGLKIG